MNTAMRLNRLVRLGTSLRTCSSCPKKPEPKQCPDNSTASNASKYFKKLKKNQTKYQVNDGQPIFLKAGFRDKVLYQGTWLMLIVALAMTFKLFFDLAKPHN